MSLIAAGVLVTLLIGPASSGYPHAAAQTGVPAGTVISGAVRDASGGAIVGASVTARVASGAERQTTSDAVGQVFGRPPAGGRVTLIVRAAGFAEGRVSLAESSCRRASRSCSSRPRVRDEVTVTPTRSEQQLGTIPASVSVIRQEDIQRRPAHGPGRPAAPTSRVQPLPPLEQPLRAPDESGRVAARHRAERREPQPRAARWRAVQRRVRRLGVLDGAADGERRAHRGGQRRQLEPVRLLRHGRRAQRRHADSRAPARSA